MKQGQVVNVSAEVVQQSTSTDVQNQSLWGENRLADVVKGTVKSKSNGKETNSGPESDSPRNSSPQHINQAVQTGPSRQNNIYPLSIESKEVTVINNNLQTQSTVPALSPPNSPEK